ncbi:uncharacterized protein LTR77_000063 [Saxophila tyrrhenica]|uniref:Uncharacterized protein n=1 Tax=Saxophila tyrrhenica TaxID=1690608 RepID=A0AAV9PQ44_9PEZI|nr:hypothetical protein LTR77_000063 [Saxophila tyrrhenica]
MDSKRVLRMQVLHPRKASLDSTLTQRSTNSQNLDDHTFATADLACENCLNQGRPTFGVSHGPLNPPAPVSPALASSRHDSTPSSCEHPSLNAGYTLLGLLTGPNTIPPGARTGVSLGPVADIKRAARNGDVRAQQAVEQWRRLEEAGTVNTGQGSQEQNVVFQDTSPPDEPIEIPERKVGERRHINSGVFVWNGWSWDVERPPPTASNVRSRQASAQGGDRQVGEQLQFNGVMYTWTGSRWDAAG